MKNSVVLVPCFKRKEYTKLCIQSLLDSQEYPDTHFILVDDGSQDGTSELLLHAPFPSKEVIIHPTTHGLRNTIVEFFQKVSGFNYMLKMDNDCLVPKDWLNILTYSLNRLPVDILSPNVFPSAAAYTYGKSDTDSLGYRPSRIVGGLWAMSPKLIEGIDFSDYGTEGIKGAFHLLNQIILEKEPRVGWLPKLIVDDIGHWSGTHPLHSASKEHAEYSANIGRQVAWG